MRVFKPPGAVRETAGEGQRHRHRTKTDAQGADIEPTIVVESVEYGSYLVVNKLGQFYALSMVFGTAYGGVMPLYAVLAREYFGPRIMGTVFGAATMVSSLGMAFGPWAGGTAIPIVRKSMVIALEIPARDHPVSIDIGCKYTASENIAPIPTHVISAPAPTITQRYDRPTLNPPYFESQIAR